MAPEGAKGLGMLAGWLAVQFGSLDGQPTGVVELTPAGDGIDSPRGEGSRRRAARRSIFRIDTRAAFRVAHCDNA